MSRACGEADGVRSISGAATWRRRRAKEKELGWSEGRFTGFPARGVLRPLSERSLWARHGSKCFTCIVLARTESRRLGINNRHLFLRVPEAGKPTIQVSADSVASQRAVFCVPHGGGGDGALWGPFYKCISPIHEGPTLIPNHLPKASPNTGD